MAHVTVKDPSAVETVERYKLTRVSTKEVWYFDSVEEKNKFIIEHNVPLGFRVRNNTGIVQFIPTDWIIQTV